MIIWRTGDPIIISNYEIIGDVHVATNRLGKGAATCSIKYNDGVKDKLAFAVLQNNKLIAIGIDRNNYIAVSSSPVKKFKCPKWAITYSGNFGSY